MTQPLRYFLLVLALFGCAVSIAAQDKSEKKTERSLMGRCNAATQAITAVRTAIARSRSNRCQPVVL